LAAKTLILRKQAAPSLALHAWFFQGWAVKFNVISSNEQIRSLWGPAGLVDLFLLKDMHVSV
jgi:hypothetical protein